MLNPSSIDAASYRAMLTSGRSNVQDYGIGGRPTVEVRHSYINNMPVDAVVGWRNGLKCVIPSVPIRTGQTFIVRYELIVEPPSRRELEKLIWLVNDQSSEELRKIREIFEVSISQNRYGGAHLYLDYHLTHNQLKQMGGTIYLHELDTVISILPFDEVPTHPYSERARIDRVVTELTVSDHTGFVFSIDIVDNFSRIGDRFAFIFNAVRRITPRKCDHRKDGAYVTISCPSSIGDEERDAKVSFYDFDQMEEGLGLYETYEKALTAGDTASAKKEELLNKEHEISRLKLIAQSQKHEHEKDMLELDAKLKHAASENEQKAQELKQVYARIEHEREIQRQAIKDSYEQKSHVRKDTSETIKFIPTLLMGMGIAYGLFQKFGARFI